jgi:hypothetical protein
MAVGFTAELPPASEEALVELEVRLGVELPDDYRRFLARTGGGELDGNFLPPEADASARYLYSPAPNDDDDIYDLLSAARFYAEIGRAYLPIGEDDGGNVVCLKVAGQDRGSVWFWTHDAFANTDPFKRLADSFDDFFDRLRPIDELELDH